VSIGTVLFTALGPLVASRCYPSEFPQTGGNLPTWPAIRYTVTTLDASPSLCGTGDEDGDTTGVQLDLVAATYAAMQTLRAQVITALQATDPPATRTGGLETWDAETKTHRAVLFYSFHASTP
jgi:hypothetical protein